jgi:glycosyltransferase involved in cell wall biosynthesis
MRILIASGTWYPERNGVARVASEVGRRLADRGHHVTAFVPRVPELPAEQREGSLTLRRAIRRGPLPLIVNDVIETSRASRRAGIFDVLLAHGTSAAFGLARAGVSAPLVLVYHASLARELRFMRPRLPWARDRLVSYVNEPLSTVLERAAVERARRILVLSEYTRSLLMADHPRQVAKVRAVSGGVETASFSPGVPRDARQRLGLDPDRPLLVTVRRAEPRMGIEQLLRALRIMRADDVALAIVGGGMLTDKLQRLSAELGLDGQVHFAGRVSEEVLLDWYRAADLFVLPTVAYEGFGMVTLEALASRTPVVGTPVGATPELLEPLDPRLVARGSDPESLAQAICEALTFSDDAFRAQCREYALARFDWDRVIGRWEEALIDAAHPGRRQFGN